MKIGSNVALRVLFAVAFCCGLSQVAFSQASGKAPLSPVEQAERLQSRSTSKANQSEAERRQREFDQKSIKTMKSICSNC